MSQMVSANAEILFDRINGILSNAEEDSYAALIESIMECNRVFIIGMGRSGLVGRFFGMRLMHLGKTVHIVGETTTPSISRGDLLIAISGSGSTSYVVHVAELAKKHQADVVGVFLKNEAHCCELEKLSDLQVRINRRYMKEQRIAYEKSGADVIKLPNITPMGTLFEISALIYFESVVGEIIRLGQIHEHILRKRHSNLE